jgi:hypothetical protein
MHLQTEIETCVSLGLDTPNEVPNRRVRHRIRRKMEHEKRAFMQLILTWATVGLTASQPKVVGTVQAATNQPIKILECQASHDGATSTNAPDVTDFGRLTFGGAGVGTGTTPLKKIPALTETIQTTGKTDYSSNPTTVVPLKTINLAQYNGLYHYITPQGSPLLVQGGAGFCVRHNSPNTVNASGAIEFEE